MTPFQAHLIELSSEITKALPQTMKAPRTVMLATRERIRNRLLSLAETLRQSSENIVLPLILLSGLVQLRNVEVDWSLITEDDPTVVSEPWFHRSATHTEVIRLTMESDNAAAGPGPTTMASQNARRGGGSVGTKPADANRRFPDPPTVVIPLRPVLKRKRDAPALGENDKGKGKSREMSPESESDEEDPASQRPKPSPRGRRAVSRRIASPSSPLVKEEPDDIVLDVKCDRCMKADAECSRTRWFACDRCHNMKVSCSLVGTVRGRRRRHTASQPASQPATTPPSSRAPSILSQASTTASRVKAKQAPRSKSQPPKASRAGSAAPRQRAKSQGPRKPMRSTQNPPAADATGTELAGTVRGRSPWHAETANGTQEADELRRRIREVEAEMAALRTIVDTVLLRLPAGDEEMPVDTNAPEPPPPEQLKRDSTPPPAPRTQDSTPLPEQPTQDSTNSTSPAPSRGSSPPTPTLSHMPAPPRESTAAHSDYGSPILAPQEIIFRAYNEAIATTEDVAMANAELSPRPAATDLNEREPDVQTPTLALEEFIKTPSTTQSQRIHAMGIPQSPCPAPADTPRTADTLDSGATPLADPASLPPLTPLIGRIPGNLSPPQHNGCVDDMGTAVAGLDVP